MRFEFEFEFEFENEFENEFETEASGFRGVVLGPLWLTFPANDPSSSGSPLGSRAIEEDPLRCHGICAVGGMSTTPRNPPSSFFALELALETVGIAKPFVFRLQRHDRELFGQTRRALTRCVLGLGEGAKRDGGCQFAASWDHPEG